MPLRAGRVIIILVTGFISTALMILIIPKTGTLPPMKPDPPTKNEGIGIKPTEFTLITPIPTNTVTPVSTNTPGKKLLSTPDKATSFSSVYVSNLIPLEATVGYGSFAKGKFVFDDPSNPEYDSGDEIVIHGHHFIYGLFAHSPSRLVYDLAGKYKTFETYIAMADKAICGDGAIFSVLIDNKEVYNSSLFQPEMQPKQILVEVMGGRQMVLITEIGKDDNGYCDWTVWGDPALK